MDKIRYFRGRFLDIPCQWG